MNNRLIVLFPLLLLSWLGYVPELCAQEIHACVVMPGEQGTQQFKQQPRYNLPDVVQKAVALGSPNTNNSSSSNFWSAGSTLRIKFMGGSTFVRQQVVRYANEWTRYANVNFSFVTSGPSDLRVSFVQNGSSWSVLGRQARSLPADRATMNFGWLTDGTPDYEFRRTILHEFGHALGLLHEHQNPMGGIPWDEEKVYAFYLHTQGWDRHTTYSNVIARQQRNETQFSAYDPASIMHYPVDPRLTRGGYEVGLNTAISTTDASFIARMYPGRTGNPPTTSLPPSAPPAPDRPATNPRTGLPDVPTNPPAARTHEVTISNRLGRSQRAEVIELQIAGRKHLFELREGQQSQQAIRLNLKPGSYPYRVRSASVYTVLLRVREGSRFVEKRKNQTIYGGGQGELRVTQDGQFSFFGAYDQQQRKMVVYLKNIN